VTINVDILEHELARTIGSFPMKPVVRVDADASLQQVATRLRLADVSFALVGPEARVIVTERDITKAMADGADPDSPVRPYVERSPVWVTTSSRVSEVIRKMGHDAVRHLIVLDAEGVAVGVVSIREIVAVLFGKPITP
jgi:predicted transcriptional regulator